MAMIDREVLRIWLAGESASLLLRHAGRLGCALADEAAIERLAEAQDVDWRTVRGAALDERRRHQAYLAATMSEDDLLDYAMERHGLPPDASQALERAAAADAFGASTDEFSARYDT